jgi:hypothetical protein
MVSFFVFFEIFSCAKVNQKYLDKSLKPRKNILKIAKIPGKFLVPHWEMSYPNKVFEPHEKDFRAFL